MWKILTIFVFSIVYYHHQCVRAEPQLPNGGYNYNSPRPTNGGNGYNNGNGGNGNGLQDTFGGYQYGVANDEPEELGSIPGIPGQDYPIYNTPPRTSFRCSNLEFPGYYADTEARCQVFHICQAGNRMDSFLCPNGTLFNQQFLVCDWYYNVDCNRATDFYSINEQIFREMQAATQRLEEAKRQQQQAGYLPPNQNGGYSYNQNGGQNGGGNRVQNDPSQQYLPPAIS